MSKVTSPEPVDWHVETRGVVKYFGGQEALGGVDLHVRRGSIHGLVGENGAGKSTLGRVIAGAIAPDAGELLVDGRSVHFRTPRDALREGITLIAQELALVPRLTVLENVILGNEPTTATLLRSKAPRQRFAELNDRTGFGLDPNRRVDTLPVAAQQKVEIMRALMRDARLVIMDEPTATLTAGDHERLFEIIRDLASDGVTIVYVSHFLEEVLALVDDVTVLKDGALVRTAPAREETSRSLVRAMVGRDVPIEHPVKADAGGARRGRSLGPGARPEGRLRGHLVRGPRGRDPRARWACRVRPIRGCAGDLRRRPGRRRLCELDGKALRVRRPRTRCAQGSPCCPSPARIRGC